MDALKSFVSITTSENDLHAFIQLSQLPEDFQMDTSELIELIKAAGITYGIDMKTLTEIAMYPQQFVGKKVMIAVGKEPVPGKDGAIHYTFLEKKKEQEQRLQNENRVDLRNVRQLDNVEEGEVLAVKIPPQEGEPGLSVKGLPIEPPKAREAHFRMGKNVEVDETGTQLLSSINGLVTFTEREKINVFPIYEVNGDVDYRVGNIDFNGTVVIRGSVLNDFRVRATGDVRVTGSVAGAYIESGGSINVTEGIVGYHKARLVAGRNIKCSFMQDVTVEVGEDIIVSRSIMHSNIRAGKYVICQGGNGLIVGGTIQAGEGVVARTIGNAMATQTVIEVGIRPELRNELSELRQQLKILHDNIEKSDKALRILDTLAAQGKLDAAKMDMRTKLYTTKNQTMVQLEETRSRILEIENDFAQMSNASVEVSGTIYPGTKIVIGRSVRFIKDAIKRVKFREVQGEVSYSPLD